jgi:hypothetical protein
VDPPNEQFNRKSLSWFDETCERTEDDNPNVCYFFNFVKNVLKNRSTNVRLRAYFGQLSTSFL